MRDHTAFSQVLCRFLKGDPIGRSQGLIISWCVIQGQLEGIAPILQGLQEVGRIGELVIRQIFNQVVQMLALDHGRIL